MKYIWEPKDIVGGRKFWSNGNYAEPMMIAYSPSANISLVSLLDGNTVFIGNGSAGEVCEHLTKVSAVPFVLESPPEKALDRLYKTWDQTQNRSPL